MLETYSQKTSVTEMKKLKKEPKEHGEVEVDEIKVGESKKTKSVGIRSTVSHDRDDELINSDYILTNFNSNDDETNELAILNKLFYGKSAFLKQRKELENKEEPCMTTSIKKQKATISKKHQQRNNESMNERFVRLHRAKEIKDANRSRYDDQSLSDDEPLFKSSKQTNLHEFQVIQMDKTEIKFPLVQNI